MRRTRTFVAALAAGLFLSAGGALAMTLDDAVALALAHDPGLRRVQAGQDAAGARLRQARAARMPSVTASASAAAASTDFGQFFGFGGRDLTPRSAQISVQQLLFNGGGVTAAVGQARAGEAGARASYQAARLQLVADVAEAFEAVRTAERAMALRQAQFDELALVLDQAGRRFRAGDAPSTEVDQARARTSEAAAGLARGRGDLAAARARFRALVGQEAVGLIPPAGPPAVPASLDEALSRARAANPSLAAAEYAVRAAEAGVRRARAEHAPTVALAAEVSSVRDQFLPGYRADGASVGVQARWPIFTGGLVSAKVEEAQAVRRESEAALEQARAAVEETAIDAWEAVQTAAAVADASREQVRAADSALESVRHEVRVGVKPTLDLLDAEREALAARIGASQAEGARVVAAYRLRAAIGEDATTREGTQP